MDPRNRLPSNLPAPQTQSGYGGRPQGPPPQYGPAQAFHQHQAQPQQLQYTGVPQRFPSSERHYQSGYQQYLQRHPPRYFGDQRGGYRSQGPHYSGQQQQQQQHQLPHYRLSRFQRPHEHFGSHSGVQQQLLAQHQRGNPRQGQGRPQGRGQHQGHGQQRLNQPQAPSASLQQHQQQTQSELSHRSFRHYGASPHQGAAADHKRPRIVGSQENEATTGSKSLKTQAEATTDNASSAAECTHLTPATWQTYVERWYPKRHTRTHFVPPVHINRFDYDPVRAGDALMQRSIDSNTKTGIRDSEKREDQAQQRILHCIHQYVEQFQQVMFVLSQLSFKNYLGETCCLESVQKFPRTIDLREEDQDRGDFDILIIHRDFGMLAAEVKAIGDRFTNDPANRKSEDKTLRKRIEKAAEQLRKSDKVLNHLFADLKEKPRVTKTLMLPNVSSARLRNFVENNTDTKENLRKCLDVPESRDPCDVCLTSDHLSERDTPREEIAEKLQKWWKIVMNTKDPQMTHELYDELLARFVGPATTVELFCPANSSAASQAVRTEGEGVSETGARFTKEIVLYPAQISVLNSDNRFVYLCGAPGTGKTIVLLLRAEMWMRQSHEVQVVSMYDESYAVTCEIEYLLKENPKNKAGAVRKHMLDLAKDGNEQAVRDLAARAKEDTLYVIIDECDGSEFLDFCTKLKDKIKHLHLWGARVYRDKYVPDYMETITLTEPLRSPPVVIREVQASDLIQKFKLVPGYEEKSVPHCDGPLPREVRHKGPGHRKDLMPIDCETCGIDLADILTELHIGVDMERPCKCQKTSPELLRYSDVFILTTFDGYRDASTDSEGNAVPASGMVQGLRSRQIPVKVAPYGDKNTMEQVATLAPNEVLLTTVRNVGGLERKVVAWVQTVPVGGSMEENMGRLHVMSRSSALLIKVFKDEPVAKPKEEGQHVEEMRNITDNSDILLQLVRQCLSDGEVAHVVNSIVQLKLSGEKEETYHFDLRLAGTGEVGAGEWRGGDHEVAATLHMTASDFNRLVHGKEEMLTLFQTNKATYSGDKGIAAAVEVLVKKMEAAFKDLASVSQDDSCN